jgi:hypothetical protein
LRIVSRFPWIEGASLKWSWGGARPSAGRSNGPQGSLVQVNVNGRRVPTYVVSRHPANWGFIMQSCWVVYMSFEMPAPGVDTDLDDENLAIDAASQACEARHYNLGMASEDEEHEEDD